MSAPQFKPLFTSQAGVEYFRRDNGDGTQTILGHQDITPLIELNREERKEEVRGKLARRGKWGQKVASIPLIMLNKWLYEHIDPRDPEAQRKLGEVVKQKLKDPDYRDFTTANMRL